MKSNEFRIFGTEIGEPDSYIDVVVDGIDDEGGISFADVDSERSWTIQNREVQRLLNQNLMLDSSQVVKHDLWKVVDSLNKTRSELTDDFADENTEDAQRSLFLAAHFETR